MIESDGLQLLVPAKGDSERELVAEAWITGGGSVLWLDRFWEPPIVDRAHARLYGNHTFCLVLAQKLNLTLVSPPDDFLVTLDPKWLKRDLRLQSILQSLSERFPRFVKTLVPKLFRAAVYQTPLELERECTGLPSDTLIISSEVVEVMAECRFFLLHQKVQASSVYEGNADLESAQLFVSSFLREIQLPAACVLDVALIDRGWMILETNAVWSAGLNGCDPLGAAQCIAHATVAA
jgi:hypothetical protein